LGDNFSFMYCYYCCVVDEDVHFLAFLALLKERVISSVMSAVKGIGSQYD
jgi:hypothetical protein